MRERRRPWATVGLVLVVTGAIPVALDGDSLPLSPLPMFSPAIDSTQSIDTAVALRADRSTARLVPERVGGTTVVNQAVSVAVRRPHRRPTHSQRVG